MKFVFRADASLSIGTGHLTRCLTLGQALTGRGASVRFVCRAHPGNQIASLEAAGFKVDVIPLSDSADPDGPSHSQWLGGTWTEDAEVVRAAATGADWIVVDHYALDARFESDVAATGARVAVIDDLADRPHDCDLLLDQTFGRSAQDYAENVPARATLLCGSSYALLRPEFFELASQSLTRRTNAAAASNILVTLGGIDVDNVSAAVLDIVEGMALGGACRIQVVMGADAPHLAAVRKQAAQMAVPTEVHAGTHAIARLMADADVAIGAAGTTAWERCCLGLPSLVAVLASNQQPTAENLHQAGAAISLGSPDRPEFAQQLAGNLRTLLDDRERRLAMTAAALTVTDGLGANRVAAELVRVPVAVEPAGMADAMLVWNWRNADAPGYARRTEADTSLDDHLQWFARALSSPDRLLLIGRAGGEDVGHIRFDQVDGLATVSIVLAPEMRGRGLGGPLLAAAIGAARGRGIASFKAVVHVDNTPSRRIFEKAGFSIRSVVDSYAVMYRDEAAKRNQLL
jgi:UDP-2,4-diacetamido-2,4,6-trideoxy-beta-L-altropyranose hydrolase